MYFRMINRSAILHILSFSQNCPVNTEQLGWEGAMQAPWGPGSLGSRPCQGLEVWAPHSYRWLPGLARWESGMYMGVRVSQEPGWTLPAWQWEGTCGRLSFPPVPGAVGNPLGGSICTSGSITDAGVVDEFLSVSVLVPLPPQASSLLPRLPSPSQESISYQIERGKKGNGAINFPLQTQPCTSALESASWNR